ncbi:MAG TPA: membrane dipeptidase [Polyangiales bacterium]|nr:membrane dipeptidase [Polyangiales bacterium]
MEAASIANALGISQEAAEIFLSSDAIDLHIESFLWRRIFGYDLNRVHRGGLFGRRFFGHADLPSVQQVGLGGATWVISTNPLRAAGRRRQVFEQNLASLRNLLDEAPGVRHVRNAAEFRAARASGEHAAFIGIQGGNALDHDLDALDVLADQSVLRVTLLHLTSSRLGATSAPGGGRSAGLTDFGKAYVERLNELRIGVDLAHISRPGFFDAVEVHDKTQPLLVTHTGLAGVYEHWRNISDLQLRAVADSGGTVGVMMHAAYLGRGRVTVATLVDHLQHIVATVGEDYASIGTDYDGFIIPPRDLPGIWALPRLVQEMLDRGWSELRIGKILGGNALRVVEALRG